MHLTLQTFSVIWDVIVAQMGKRGEIWRQWGKRERERGGGGESSDSGIASLIEFYGNVAYISTFSFAAAKEIREAAEKLF